MKGIKWGFILLAFLALGALTVVKWNAWDNSRLHLTEYTFCHQEIPKSFDGYRLLVISDLHEAPFGEQALELIQETQPDVILFCGDLVQLPGYSFEETQKIARGVKNTIPMYAVSGNHESQNPEYDHIVGNLWDEGIVWLEDDRTRLKKAGEEIVLIGMKDCGWNALPEERVREELVPKVKELLPEDGEDFTILLSHRANLYPYFKDIGVDLILSGHMHGGLIRLPFAGGVLGRENGEFLLFPDYTYGYYHEGKAAMIVSGGCDQNEEKKRVFNPPEVVLVTLERERG